MDLYNNIKDMHIKIDKEVLFNMISKMHSSELEILEQFKQDFNDMHILLNNKEITYYIHLLNYIINNEESYLKNILLLSNKGVVSAILHIIKDKICLTPDVHILQKNSAKTSVNISLNRLIKQVYIIIYFKLVKINRDSDIIFKKTIKAEIILDLGNYEPVLIMFGLND